MSWDKKPVDVSPLRGAAGRVVIMVEGIPMNKVEELVQSEIAEQEPIVKNASTEDTWHEEKRELLRTHPGWFVAYQDGRRIALEPSLDRLIMALDKQLGTPRKPCEFHEIVQRPATRRGPSPRLMPTDL